MWCIFWNGFLISSRQIPVFRFPSASVLTLSILYFYSARRRAWHIFQHFKIRILLKCIELRQGNCDYCKNKNSSIISLLILVRCSTSELLIFNMRCLKFLFNLEFTWKSRKWKTLYLFFSYVKEAITSMVIVLARSSL